MDTKSPDFSFVLEVAGESSQLPLSSSHRRRTSAPPTGWDGVMFCSINVPRNPVTPGAKE